MPSIQLTAESRVTHDSENHAIRSWFDPSFQLKSLAPFVSRNLARQVLQDNADLFFWKPDLPDLKEGPILETVNALSVRFYQEFKGIPVDSSEVLVNVMADGRVHSIYNHYHYDIPDSLNPKKIKINEKQARQLVQKLLGTYEKSKIYKSTLIVYQYQRSENRPPKPAPKPIENRAEFLAATAALMLDVVAIEAGPREKKYFVAWDITATTEQPTHSWRILVDAISGKLVNVVDLLQYASGNGQVFDPNPIVTSGDTSLSSATPVGTLDAQLNPVVCDRLDAAVGGQFHLDGSYAKMEEIEAPVFAEPTSATADFSFSSGDREFLACMVYYHVDRFQDYVQTILQMMNVANFSIPIDPQGFAGADNSRYDPVAKDLAFGEGGIPDAADADVILHEYGHAIQDAQNPGFSNYASGISEGFGDVLAAVFHDDKHANPTNTRGIMMAWDANPTDGFWPGRRYDVNWLFDGPEYEAASGHGRAQIWCATIFELYRKLGGDTTWYPGRKKAARDLAIKLHLIANINVATSGASASDMGQQIEIADSNLGGWVYADGLHKKVIYDTFRRRRLAGYSDPTVDVYIDDGRAGGYGSASGNDLFTEKLWQENYWNTEELWVKTSAYPDPAAQAAGGPGDHGEPPVGSTAYLYVRVKNRGTDGAGSGPVTVKAFHCEPGMGLVWPDAWSPMDTASIDVANILPGGANGVIVGPFPWTPTLVGHECLLGIVECANDRAITQDLLATDHVSHSDLVPFDNNVGQRNIHPTTAKGRKERGFYVTNPFDTVKTVTLRFESTLPKGWSWRTGLVGDEIRLGPLERRWVNLIIDQAGGQEVTAFDRPHTLTVTGAIDEASIGGMTFYVAPPTAGVTVQGEEMREISPADLLCLNIPWAECEVEGELEIKLRFRKK